MANFILSGFADEYSASLDRQLEMLSANGFAHLEPRGIDGVNIADITDAKLRDLTAKLADSGISVDSVGSPLGKINIADDFAAHLDRAKRVYEIGSALGARRVRMFSFYLPEGKTREECRSEVIDRVGALLDAADPFGLKLCHENEARIYGENAEQCLDLLKAFNGRLGCVFDMGNFVLDDCQPFPHSYDLLKPYIEYLHIKDSCAAGSIVPPGCGEASIPEILSAINHDFEGDVVLTLEPHLNAFVGLDALVGKSFDQPYSYPTQEDAFLDAASRLKDIVARVQSA